MDKLLVKAKSGEKCPREDNPRTYITDNPKGTEVDNTSYYRRLLEDTSLVIVPNNVPAKSKGGDQ